MNIWSSEIKDLEQIYKLLKGTQPELEKELERLIVSNDENMLLVYSRRCLEVIVTWLCEHELKRKRGTEPLQRIIDKLNKEEIVPHNIIVAMHNVNSMYITEFFECQASCGHRLRVLLCKSDQRLRKTF